MIKVGDLVAVVKPAGHGPCGVGLHFVVTKIRKPRRASPGQWQCSFCGKSGIRVGDPRLDHAVAEGYGERGMPISRLKRIPPLEELEGIQSEEVRKLPANRTPTKARA